MSTFSSRLRPLAVLGAAAVFAGAIALNAAPVSAGEESYEYSFDFVNGASISGTSTDKVTFIPEAGGASVDAPTGMDVHLSCSDKFAGGFGEKDGPDSQTDSAWQIDSYTINKLKDGEVDKTCSGSDLANPGNPGTIEKGNVYSFTFVNGVTIAGVSDGNTAFLPNAGGSSVENPIGMNVHVSCSDEFPDGFGEKDGPEAGRDSAWQIASYLIQKIDKGEVKKTCGDDFSPPLPTGTPSVDIEKSVNGEDADSPTGPEVLVGDTVTFAYVVTNDGDVPLSNVVVVDETLGAVTCPRTELGVGESMSCDEKTKVVTEAGQAGMNSTVTAEGLTRAPGIDDLDLGDDDGYAYSFTFVNGMTISGISADKTGFIPNAGGTSAASPIGMEVHLSCSDEFEGGFGQKDGPDPDRDPAWQIASYEIGKIKDGEIDKRCGEAAAPVSVTVTDSDPVNFIAVEPKVPSIDIEKSVNGYDADDAPGPEFEVGDTVTFRYVVTNTGDTLLINVTVTDSILGDIGCVVPDLGPGGSYGCPAITETVTQPGAYFMEGTVTGESPQGVIVDDIDPVNFTVKDSVVRTSSIDIEKSVNGFDADTAPGPNFKVGDEVTFLYVVTNTGDTLLTNVSVTDSVLGAIACTVPNLGPGGSYTCPPVKKVLVELGPVYMNGSVTGVDPGGNTVSDDDPVNFWVKSGSVVDP